MTTILRAPPATVVLDGEIDIATSPAIRESLMAAINAGNVHLAVDMSGVAFIDAAGIGVLVAAANRAREAGAAAPGRLAPGRDPAGLYVWFVIQAFGGVTWCTAGSMMGGYCTATPRNELSE
jgi:ABC-type transporter Mla MlaB component